VSAEFSRRRLIRSLCASTPVFTLQQLLSGEPIAEPQFVNIAREAGLRSKTIFGAENKNRLLLETTGCGVAFYDYDHDGWLDIFLVNGTRFEANWAKADAPVSRLYKNNRDGTFTDVTLKSGLARTGWGQGCCVGDYDNDGLDDLLVTYWGDCVLYRNNLHRRLGENRSRKNDACHGRRPEPVEHRLRVCRLRPGRLARYLHRQLHRFRSEDGGGTRGRALSV
jgi:hypothetical protein